MTQALAPPRPASIAALTFSRFTGNLGYRLLFPFLPAFARGLGIDLTTAGAALSIRDLAGLLAPAAGRIADSMDRRLLLTGAAATTGVALGMAGLSTGFAVFALALFVANTAKLTHDITMGAWIGDRVPFGERGRVIGLTETSWAMAQLAGIPVTGLIIDSFGWRAGFFAVMAINLMAALVLPGTVPPERDRAAAPRGSMRLPRSVWGLVAANTLLAAGMQIIFVTYGAWLEDDYGLSIAALGAVALAFGVGELLGSALMIRFTDRFGKRQSVIVGLVPMVGLILALPYAGPRIAVAVVLMCALVLVFEFTIISAIPLLTELNTESRGTGLGLSIAAQTLARAGGSIGGTILYSWRGMTASTVIGAWLTFAALIVFIVAVGEPPSGTDDGDRETQGGPSQAARAESGA